MRRLVLLVFLLGFLLAFFLACSPGVQAQQVFRDDEILASDRPEAWAMNYFTAATLLTAQPGPSGLSERQWRFGVELAHIPRLSTRQQRVGFNGFKQEDLNKSPVFGRMRLSVSTPAGWHGELGYTPAVSVGGARPVDLVAISAGRRLIGQGSWSASARAFAQYGAVRGDFTCPRDIAGIDDSARNPYGCMQPSNDRISLGYYGIDLLSQWNQGHWHWHSAIGVMRTESEVQVEALTFDVIDRSRLVTHDVLPFAVIGVSRDLSEHWGMGVHVLHVPLSVRRAADARRERDPLTSLRAVIHYRLP